MNEKDEAMLLRMSETTMRNCEMVMQRVLQLAQTQLEIIEGATNDIGGEYRSLMTMEDAAATMHAWPTVFESTRRRATEGTTAFLENLVEFQSEILQMMQSRMLEFNTQLSDDLIGRMRMGVARDIPITEAPSPRKKPALQSVRTRKAA